jgi:hypothetical protein
MESYLQNWYFFPERYGSVERPKVPGAPLRRVMCRIAEPRWASARAGYARIVAEPAVTANRSVPLTWRGNR